MQPSDQPTIPLLAIVGPTAVGKTALSIALAQALGGEIVSADSRQVFRQMDIGTAKPTAAERAAAPHHLIDVVDPDQDFSLGLYQDLAMAAIDDIAARGRLPLLVGGTGQYLAALLQGWNIRVSRRSPSCARRSNGRPRSMARPRCTPGWPRPTRRRRRGFCPPTCAV